MLLSFLEDGSNATVNLPCHKKVNMQSQALDKNTSYSQYEFRSNGEGLIQLCWEELMYVSKMFNEANEL